VPRGTDQLEEILARSKESKEDEFYKGKIRDLEKLVKTLRKHIRQLEKQRHLWENTKDDDDMHEVVKEEMKVDLDCPKCKQGVILYTDLGIKMLKTCSICTWRKTEKK